MPDEALSRLVHDLRSPLMIVEGFAQLLERDDATLDAERRGEYVHRIREAAADMREIVDRAG